MAQTDVLRWDVVLTGSNNHQTPMLTFIPSLKQLEFIQNNNYMVRVTIFDSNTCYDGVEWVGLVARRCGAFGNCLPNYSESDPYFSITLMATWFGYPPINSKAKMSFIGME